MDRRTVLAGATALLVAPRAAPVRAADKVANIGVLSFGSPEPFREGLRQALARHGYVEGRNVVIDHLTAGGRIERLAGLAAELVRRKVDLIIARSSPSVEAATNATRTIPIVMATAGDALRTGLVSNLARPGGNVTGLSLALVDLAGKTVALFREALPNLRRIACVVHREDPLHRGFLAEVESSAKRIGLRFQPLVLGQATEIGGAFASMGKEDGTGVVFQPIFAVDPPIRAMIAQLALEHGLPSVSGLSSFAEAGGLIAYASEFSDVPTRAAIYIDKILKGARPGDLAVEQPTHFQIVVNMKTARTLGVKIAPSLLSRADQVIE